MDEAAVRDIRVRGRTLALPRALAVGWSERAPFVGIAALALALRLVELTGRPLHHDESSHAWFSWQLTEGNLYQYNPVFHGPVQFYSGAIGYLFAGVGDLGIRLMPALLGAALTMLPYFLRRQLGSTAALVAAVLLCISPSYLYFSRFAREDIYAAFITLVLTVLTFRFLDTPKRWYPAGILGVLAVAFATKEATYITVFVAGTFFIAVAAREVWRSRRSELSAATAPLLTAIRAPRLDAWIWGIATFALVFTVLFTTFLLHPEGLRDGAVDSLRYWLSQHEVNRGSQPRYFYLVLLVGYELPILLLGLVGAVVAIRKPTLLRVYLVWGFVGGLAVYSWAGERMPWLVLHPLLPLVLLAGLGAQALWRGTGRRRVLLAAGGVASLVFLAHGAIAAAYRHPADPAEILVFTQTSTEFATARDRLFELDRRFFEVEGRHLNLHVDDWGGTGWPWGWYLRDRPVYYADMSDPAYRPDAEVIVVSEPNHEAVRPRLARFTQEERFHLREWWVVDYGGASAGDIARWALFREAWSVKGTMDEFLYVRSDVAARFDL